MPRRVALLLGLSFALLSPAVRAQDFIGTRALALGEAYRAIATGNDAIYMNPAGIVMVPRYSPELHYSFNLDAEDHQFDVSVVDSKTTLIAAGLAYTFQGRELTRRLTLQHTATLAIAYPIFPRLFSVGVGLKYVNISDAVIGNYLNALSGDLGGLATLPGGLSLAAVGYNLIPIRSTDVPLSAGFGLAWDLGPLSGLFFGATPMLGKIMDASGVPVDVVPGAPRGPLFGLVLTSDWHIDFFSVDGKPKSRISAGAEYLLFDMVPLRFGYQWNEKDDDHLMSVGAGFIVPYFGLDVAYQQSVIDPDHRTFAMSLKFFFDL